MNLKVISRNVGIALLVSSLFMLLSVGISLLDGGDSALAPLLISFALTFTVGIFPFIFVRRTERITLKDGYMIIFLSWLLSFLFGMLPYALWGGPFTLANAWFESVSGFTTTGSTILEDVEALPRSLLFWRASTHFIGGLGVVVFLLLIIPNSSPVRLRLTNMELSSLSRDDYRSRANKTVFIFAWVFLGICALAFVSYMLAGMGPFDAICHAFSVCATGGFSSRNLSIGYFQSDLISVLTIVFMFLASVHFGLIFMTLATRTLRPLNNPVLKFYAMTLIVASLLSGFSLKMQGVDATWWKAFLDASFHVVSYASTSGLAISDNSVWPMLPCFILFLLSLVCGCAGSTTGGLKSDRVLVLVKAVRMQIVKTLYPSSVFEVKFGNRVLRDEEVYPQILYIAMFFLLIGLSSILCILFGDPNQHALLGTVASLTNVGPSLGTIGSFGNYNAEPNALKLIFSFDMFLGRVEIYPVFAVFASIFHQR
ncbi:MAG: TrkH family potassium uptake protein [Bacteroidales bacterium]|jgi:trk system potassium uptake protein TrkH|nr:TrkH family potassium uptake protein [Bacteroidales bacterium]MBR4688133.1 TrkH family potassium uptake protein [Bacteroidales bacterium]